MIGPSARSINVTRAGWAAPRPCSKIVHWRLRLYRRLELTVKGFGNVEVVTRDRYALFRTTRIFADLTVMRDALRVVIHLGRRSRAPNFIKIAKANKRVSHVALVQTAEDLSIIMPFLREAFDLSERESV